MAARPDYRVYGGVEGLERDRAEALGREAGFDLVEYRRGVLTVEHEGRFVDVEAFAAAVAAALPETGVGHVDLIDNGEWTVTRYALRPGKVESETYGIDDVLEHTKGEGNF